MYRELFAWYSEVISRRHLKYCPFNFWDVINIACVNWNWFTWMLYNIVGWVLCIITSTFLNCTAMFAQLANTLSYWVWACRNKRNELSHCYFLFRLPLRLFFSCFLIPIHIYIHTMMVSNSMLNLFSNSCKFPFTIGVAEGGSEEHPLGGSNRAWKLSPVLLVAYVQCRCVYGCVKSD